MYRNLMEAGWSFRDIDEADYYGLLDVLSEDAHVMTGERILQFDYIRKGGENMAEGCC
ncbi:hypothetical protein O2313_11715 [Bacillus amyloliquefaciens]|uniref:hypothetical protein n=1 Tax=Bacillus amyloliquefaciens TaxID=1390 RepID=UPI0022B02F0C|nr:hypothetical protein [Bacillus amyloliquefaciens]MCZ4248189.1 hypothetical protein [Bacillus amyloliquefaciens]